MRFEINLVLIINHITISGVQKIAVPWKPTENFFNEY